MSMAMRSFRNVAILLPVLLASISCNRDPNVAKRRYLESGNRYFDRGKYKEAAIMYRDALQKDLLWGPAHYKLALTYLKMGQVGGAVQELRKAVERLPMDSPDHWAAAVNLCDLFLEAQTDVQDKRRTELLDETDGYIKQLLARDSNSFDGHRLRGDELFVKARFAAASARKEEAQQLANQAAEEFRKADSIKPGQPGVLMQLARLSMAQNDLPGAEKILRQIIDKDKTAQIAYEELYRLQILQGKAKDGEETLKEGYRNNPKAYVFLVNLARHYSWEQRRDDMIKVLEQIKSHAKDFPPAYEVVGDFYLRLGDGDSAIREYREGMAQDPKKKLDFQKRIVDVLVREGKRNEAADRNAEILKEHPDDNDARGLEGTLLLDKGDVTRALTELQSVSNRAPNNPVAHFNLGQAYVARQELASAQQQFERAVEIRPDYLQARLALAQIQVARGDFDGALKSASAVLSVDRGNFKARLIGSAALMGQKKFPEARQTLEGLLKVMPNSPDVYFQLGMVNLSENKFKDAEAAFRKSFDLNPSNLRGMMGLAETFMAQNKPDAALGVLQSESSKQPARTDLKIAMGNIAVRAGRFDQAVQFYQGVLNSLDPKSRGDVYVRLGETYRRKGDLADAIASFQKARETMPDNIVALGSLALALDAADRWNEARQVYDAALKVQPDNAVVLNNDAFLMAEHGGDLDQALTMAQRAKQLQPDRLEITDTLGWIYLKKNLSEEAVDLFKQLVSEQPNASTYHYHLAMAYFQKGDKPHAQKELQEAMKDSPPAPEKQKIQELQARL